MAEEGRGDYSAMLKELDLNGTWRARWTDGQRGRLDHAKLEDVDEARYIDAEVPGEIHMDVWKQGWIKDPYVGTNCLAARWVEECIWSYRRFFTAPRAALKGRAWRIKGSGGSKGQTCTIDIDSKRGRGAGYYACQGHGETDMQERSIA